MKRACPCPIIFVVEAAWLTEYLSLANRFDRHVLWAGWRGRESRERYGLAKPAPSGTASRRCFRPKPSQPRERRSRGAGRGMRLLGWIFGCRGGFRGFGVNFGVKQALRLGIAYGK